MTSYHTALIVATVTLVVFALSHAVVRALRLGERREVPEPFSAETHRVMIAAGMAAGRRGAVGLPHVVLGLLKSRGAVREVLRRLDGDTRPLMKRLKGQARQGVGPAGALSPEVQRALAAAAGRAAASRRVATHQLLLAVLETAPPAFVEDMAASGVSRSAVDEVLAHPEAAGWIKAELAAR